MYKNSSTAINGLIQGAYNTVNNIFHTGYDAVGNVTKVIQKLIPDTVKNNTSLIDDQKEYKTSLERIKIERERLKHQAETDAKFLEFREKEIQLQEKELQLKELFLDRKLSLIQKYHEENIQLKLQEFQNHWDVHHLPFILSREETQKLFFPKSYTFWILLSPPKIENNIPEFQSLCTQLEDRINSTIKKYYYLGASRLYPIGFRQIFDRPIEKIQAVHARELLTPVPTLILSSVVTEREVYMTLTLPNSTHSNNTEIDDQQISFPSWDWEEIKASLESTGQDSKVSIHNIKELIAIIHTILAIYSCDIYCLNIDPYHAPKFYDFLQDSDVPEKFHEWVAPFKTSLQQLQESSIKKLSPSNNANNIYTSDWEYMPAIITVMGIIFVIGSMLNSNLFHISSKIEAVSANKKITRNSKVLGVVKANHFGYNAVILRSLPSIKSKEISKLINDEHVALSELSNDGQWRKVTTNNGLSGWVWAKSVREKK
jgi:hypothetical protein